MFEVAVYPDAQAAIDTLPPAAARALAEVWAVLEVQPWSGPPYNQDKPDGVMRTRTFGEHGEGYVTYLVLDPQRRVDVLAVTWIG